MTRTLFTAVAGMFAVGGTVQVYLTALGLFVDAGYRGWQRSFVHVLELLSPLLLVLAFAARLPVSFHWLSAATFGLIAVQCATIELGVPVAAAFHPVSAVILFWLTITLARR